MTFIAADRWKSNRVEYRKGISLPLLARRNEKPGEEKEKERKRERNERGTLRKPRLYIRFRATTSLPMLLELKSYLNVPRISEIELFLDTLVRGWFTYVISRDGRATLSQMRPEHLSCFAKSRERKFSLPLLSVVVYGWLTGRFEYLW